ncbi:Ig-like domain-containing protein, partial [Nanoarchaeota archaeon]
IGWYSVASDNFGNWNNSMPIQTFQIMNRPPVLNATNQIPNITWPEDTINDSLYLNQHFYDLDSDNLTYSNTSIQNITVQINQTTTQVTFTPDNNFTGVRYITFYASDLFNTTASNNVTLNVSAINDPPFMDNITLNPNSGSSGTSVNISTIGAGDVDGDNYRLQCGNSSGTFNLCNSTSGTGERSCTFVAPWVGLQTQTIYCILNDTIDISVVRNASFYAGNSVPSAPVVNITPLLATSLHNLTCSVTVNSTDADNDSISYLFQWYNSSQLILSYGPVNQTSHLLTTNYTTNSELWNCTVTPFDGKSYGNASSDVIQLIACDCPDCNPPVINPTIPDQRRSFNQGNWTLNLSSYKSDVEDSGSSLTWSVQGVNPLFMDIGVSGDTITFAPKQDISGMDKVVIVLTDTDGLIDTQEVRVGINRTIEFRNGWNLFSVPILENKSVQYVLTPFGNGNYGCGHDNAPPYNCVPGDGDFAGDWTILWTQDNSGSWIYFRPDVYYTFIPTQDIQTLEVDQGYWIEMNLTSPINLTLQYD